METIIVDGASLTLEDVEAVARHHAEVRLSDDSEVVERIRRSRELNETLMAEGMAIYGVTTGVGDSVDRHVGIDRVDALQSSLVKMLGCGVGDYLSVEACRAILLARVNCLAKGYSAVRPELIERLVLLLNRDLVPCIPEIGSVGASGDLIPSSYIAAVVTGERHVYDKERMRPTRDAFRDAGIEPMTLAPKEGIALVNGTNVMTGLAALAVQDAHRIARLADACTALTTEALTGIGGPFEPFLHEATKPHPGQVASAARIKHLLEGSRLARDYHETVSGLGTTERGLKRVDVKIQDQYSVRCAPHCIGALLDAVTWIRETLRTELNSANDNPLYDVDAGVVRSGGNFSGFHVALAMDTLKVAVSSVSDLIDRQFALVNDEKYNMGLGMCCIHPRPDDDPDAGTHHGFKGAQLAISALTAEALHLASPMTVFSRSTACHSQDKVSMGATAARQAVQIVSLVENALALHLLLSCQAADIRGADKLAEGTRRIYEAVRAVSPYVERDRELQDDIVAVRGLIRSRELLALIPDEAQ